MKNIFFSICLLPILTMAQQVGGKSTFAFLNMPINARVAGLGGEIVSQRTDDANLIRYNPASGNYSMSKNYSFNYMNYYGDVYLANTNFAYAKDSTKILWAGNLSYLDYGKLDSYDDGGNYVGQFRAREFSAVASAAKKVQNYSLGVNLGLSSSNIAGYNAHAVFMDIGGQFIHPKKPIIIGVLVKNIGFNIDNYTKRNRESLPIDIQAGITVKPEHMPLRFNVTLHKLYRYNVSYYDPKSKVYVDQSSDVSNRKPNVFDKAIRHVNVGVEAILSKNFQIRSGYSFMRRQDLKYQVGSSGWAGFSVGAMIRVKKFSFEYTQIFYHAVGTKGIFTLGIKL